VFSTDGILGRDFAVLAAGMDGLAMRQRVHAENLANIDTPGYQARTVDFESTLRKALKSDDASTGPMGANGAMLPNPIADAATAGELSGTFNVVKRPISRFGDGTGNSDGIDRTQEVSDMMTDNIRFRVLSQQVTNRISELRSVIQEMGRG
jgi:flagellar basal-body rod protein FlgB